jgi:hypothetical protein
MKGGSWPSKLDPTNIAEALRRLMVSPTPLGVVPTPLGASWPTFAPAPDSSGGSVLFEFVPEETEEQVIWFEDLEFEDHDSSEQIFRG